MHHNCVDSVGGDQLCPVNRKVKLLPCFDKIQRIKHSPLFQQGDSNTQYFSG